MKHTTALFLALLLVLSALPAAVAETEAAPLHTLWDIPWGVSPEEFCALAEEKTGILFEINRTADGSAISNCMMKEGQNVAIFGQPVRYIAIQFDNNTDGFQKFSIVFIMSREMLTLETILQSLQTVSPAVFTKYGTPTFSRLNANHPISGGLEYFAVPMKDDAPDYEKFLDIYRETGDYTSVAIHFSNIDLWASLTPVKDDPSLHHSRLSISGSASPDENVQRLLDENPTYPSYDDVKNGVPTPTPAPDINVGL